MRPPERLTSFHSKRGLPPTSALPPVLQTLGCRWWPFDYLEYCHRHLGDSFTVYPVNMPPLVFLSNPADIRAIVTAPPDVLHPGAGADVIAPLIGDDSFMLCEEDEHLNGRNATLPAFHRKVVEKHAELLTRLTQEAVASWPLDSPFPLHPYLRDLTLKVILATIFGHGDELLGNLHQLLMQSLSVTQSFVIQEPQLRHLPGWHTTWKRFTKRRAEADHLINALIRRRRATEVQHDDLLEALLAAKNTDGRSMTDSQIRDHLMSMILAGHETTTAELAWAFQLLAHHPYAQSRLREEIDAETEHDYLTATIHETLRHRPAFLFIIPRAVAQPTEIGGFSYHGPERLLGCTYLMHHDPTYFPEPHTFRPERFLDEKRTPGTWLPWGAGHKRCIGRHFALQEIQAILREVLANHAIGPAGRRMEHPRWRSAILIPHAGSRVILRQRHSRRRTTRASRHSLESGSGNVTATPS